MFLDLIIGFLLESPPGNSYREYEGVNPPNGAPKSPLVTYLGAEFC